MSEAGTVEERLGVLEREIAELKRQMASPRTSENWFTLVAGSFKDEPEFEEVLRLGREIRRSDRPDAQT